MLTWVGRKIWAKKNLRCYREYLYSLWSVCTFLIILIILIYLLLWLCSRDTLWFFILHSFRISALWDLPFAAAMHTWNCFGKRIITKKTDKLIVSLLQFLDNSSFVYLDQRRHRSGWFYAGRFCEVSQNFYNGFGFL